MEPITIILTNRNTKEFLALAIESIRKNQAANHELIIMDDNSTDGSKEWLRDNRIKYSFAYHTHEDKERHGIVGMVDEGVALATHPVVYILHSDMYVAKGFDENLMRYLKPKKIVCSTRIEPPLHPPEPCKITQDFGVFPDQFKEKEFNEFAEKIIKERSKMISRGIFAPTMTFKKEWPGHDKLFYPQSEEDSDMWQRAARNGYKFIQAWDSLVYHFTSRGSRFNNETKNTLKDSEEWKKYKQKNIKNFIRRYGTTPLYTQSKEPVVLEKTNISATVLACDRDSHLVQQFLEMTEPYFDEFVFVIDSDGKTKTKIEEEIEVYCNKAESVTPTNFNREKIKIYHKQLNGDFGGQTNYATSKCTNDWVMKLDLDEVFNETFLNGLIPAIQAAEEEGKLVIGFPRINLLNQILVNDIPRNEWTEEGLKNYPPYMYGKPISLKNPDYQFRLHKKNVLWIGKVHEVPEPVINQQNKVMVEQRPFFHPKELNRQAQQNNMYSQIGKKQIKNLIYDSVIFTTEGITKHAREEIRELAKRDYKIQLLDWYRFNPKIENCEEFKKHYNPIDIKRDDVAVICNQPPTRWMNKCWGFPNFIGYLAFEGYLPNDWTEIMNKNEVKEIWTPSNYCKEKFIKSGVKKPIHIIPHGINPDVWKPLGLHPKQDEPFTYLWVGTPHNSRKGMDLVIKAFTTHFKPEDNVRLILKTNKIYNKNQDINKEIHKNVVFGGNTNIYYIDEDLTEDEMVKLFNSCQAFVSPHRSEGFGINILQALACGVPTIATRATGNVDFCTEENTWFIDVEKEEKWAPFIYPYINTMWPEPKLDSLINQMKFIKDNYDFCKRKALDESQKIREQWTWGMVANKIEKRLKEL